MENRIKEQMRPSADRLSTYKMKGKQLRLDFSVLAQTLTGRCAVWPSQARSGQAQAEHPSKAVQDRSSCASASAALCLDGDALYIW